jgi:hypothetical protein
MPIIYGGKGKLLGGVAAAAPSTLLTGIVAYWKLDEVSAGVGAVQRNDSVGTNHLTENNPIPSAAGILSNGADFISANSRILSVADNPSISTGDIDFTFAGWIKFTTAVGTLLSKWGGGGHQEHALWISGARFTFTVSNDGNGVVSVTGNTFGVPPTGAWIFFVAWHDSVANTLNIQINNGAADSAAHATGVFDSDSPLTLGYLGGAGVYLNGVLDEVGFWKRTLTAPEKTSLYNGGAGLTYPFDGSLGLDVAYQSPYNWRTT